MLYENVYPGVDLVYYGNQRQLEYDLIVAPGTDPGAISLGIEGAEHVELDPQGNLILHIAGGELRLHKPVLHQEVAGVRQEVAGRYVFRRGNQVSFEVAAYDASQPLVIDPVLVYSTYLGGSDGVGGAGDLGRGIAVDAAGNAYVTGQTSSSDFPAANPLQPTLRGGVDVFVAKFDPSGSNLIYSTYLGGSGGQIGRGITVDAAGNAYVTGNTASTDFPTANPFQATFGGGRTDNFVTKLNASGSALVYSTYLGGSDFETSQGVAVDSQGNVYVAGSTQSANFPTTTAALDKTLGGTQDAFITKLNPSGSALAYSTYLGGNSSEEGIGVAVDSFGNAYVAGNTSSTDFPLAVPFQPALAGGLDGFVTKLNAAGSALDYSTYLGGSGSDFVAGIAVDPNGSAYVTGTTRSTDFPAANPFQPACRFGRDGCIDAFVTKLNAAGSALVYSTYLGGGTGQDGSDGGAGIAVDTAGNAYVTGGTVTSDFPVVNPLQSFGGVGDAFVTTLDPVGSTLFSSYLGGSNSEEGLAIALDSAGNTYVTGFTDSTNFPTTPGAFQSTVHGEDAFVTKISPVIPLSLIPSPNSLAFSNQLVGTTSSAQTVTFTNNSTASVTISSVGLTGSHPGDFSKTADTCSGATLAPAHTCTISVSFTPTANGGRSANLTTIHDGVGSPQNVPMSGTGITDFTISVSPTSRTVTPGQSATYTITVSPQGSSFDTAIAFSCSLPSTITLADCALSPTPVTPGTSPATSTLTVTTTAASGTAPRESSRPPQGPLQLPLYAFWLVVSALAVLLSRRQRRFGFSLCGLCLVCFLIGCGGGQTPTQPRPGTPPGTYTITVKGTSDSLQHSTTATLIVQ